MNNDKGVFCDADKLVFHEDAPLPSLCLRCGKPPEGEPISTRLTWNHPALALLIFLGIGLYVIVYFVTRQVARVDLPFCDHHYGERRRRARNARNLAIGGGVLLVVSLALWSGWVAIVGAAVCLFAAGLSLSDPISPTKIEKRWIWLKGVSPAFLASVPAIRKQGRMDGLVAGEFD